ncbi:hypothetical protein KAT36_02275 [Candidatus Pacearchaeota archaeon]|nr:hypothetical protein [Candidatus Pacearchaeota archaeon]
MIKQLSFQNFYVFEITLGILSILAGFSYGTQISPYFLLLSLLGGGVVFDGIKRWYEVQKNKEILEGLDLDFDIKRIDAEADLEFIPEDIVDGQPVGEWHTEHNVKYKIEINVFNPSTIENVVRDIRVEFKKNKRISDIGIKSSEDLNRFPISLKGRTHERIIFHTGFSNTLGKKGDKLKITLVTIDNKKISKDIKISHYREGEQLRRG